MMKKIEYKEKQRFRSWDVYLLLGFFFVGLIYRAVGSFAGWWEASPSNSVAAYLLFATLVGGLMAYYYSIRFFTVINEKGIKFQFYPLHRKKRKISWEEVEDCRVVKVSPQAALTGWAVGFLEEKRFSVTGRRSGLALDLKDGEHVFIGTRDPESVKKVVKKILKKKED